MISYRASQIPLRIPVISLCDAFGVVSNVNSTCPKITEKRLLLDVRSIWEMVDSGGAHVLWIPTEFQLADPLTKLLLEHRLVSSVSSGVVQIPVF